MRNRKITLDLWKFIAALLIIAHHAVLIGQKGDYIFHGGYNFTEFFFIASGFFMTKGLEEQRYKEPWEYTKKMCKRIIPYTTVAIIVHYVIIAILSKSFKEALKILFKMPMEVFLLSELHITSAQFGQLWYLAAMIIVMPVICWLFVKDKRLYKVLMVLIPIVWYGYAYTKWGYLGHRGVFIDLIRATANLLLGSSAFYIVDEVNKQKITNWIYKVGITILGWSAFVVPMIICYNHYWTEYDFYCIFFFLIACIACQLEGFMDLKVSWLGEILGEFSLSLYVVHVPIGRYVQRLSIENVKEKYLLYYGGSFLAAAILIGVIAVFKNYVIKRRHNNK